MDCNLLFDMHWLSETFGGAKIWNFDIKPTEKFAYSWEWGDFR